MKRKWRIALIGPRAAGKSTVLPILAARLHLPSFDLDRELELRHGEPVADLLRRVGEASFRDLEYEVLRSFGGAQAHVLATGGGIVTTAHARQQLAEQYLCLGVIAAPQVLAARIQADGGAAKRPALRGEDPAREVTPLLEERLPHYLKLAHACWSSTRLGAVEIAAEMERYLCQNS